MTHASPSPHASTNAHTAPDATTFDVFDLHCDTLDALGASDLIDYPMLGDRDPHDNLAHNHLQLSADRTAGMRWCQCYAIWVPDNLPAGVTPLDFYRRLRTYYKEQTARLDAQVRRVDDPAQIRPTLDSGRMAALLTVENGSPIGHDLDAVHEFATDGVHMVTLTWNGPNSIGSGNQTTDGLSSFGLQALRELQSCGIVVDVSHLNEAGFWDVEHASDQPFVASHSNSRAVCNHPRNLADDQFRAICERGGLVGLNYYRSFITERAVDHGGVPASGEVTFDELASHVEHWLDLGGEDVVALGSDFDGSTVPAWLDGCQQIPTFHQRMVERFGEDLCKKIFFENANAFFVRMGQPHA
ncbi:MAG: dipeptidase [Atopobiaceae bacterium]